MELLDYQVNVNELDGRFITALKSLFHNGEILISVKPLPIEAPAVARPYKSIWELIEANEKADHRYQMTAGEFSEMADAFEADEHYDLVGFFEKHKVLNGHAEPAI